MPAEQRSCQSCNNQFTIEPEDFEFYKKLQVPPPTWCPDCRMVRRLIARNERALYRRPCAMCKEDKIMMFPAESRFTPYCYQCWWSDKWDPMSYGREYDFSKPFFEQFSALMQAVPRPGIIKQGNTVNSEYVNRCSDSKNNYLVFATISGEDSMYSAYIDFSKECVDCYHAQKSEQCYESVDCYSCSRLLYSRECDSCTDSAFLLNCRNCTNCFGCVNLRNKSYCIWNRQYTKEEYAQKVKELRLDRAGEIESLKKQAVDFQKQFIVPMMVERHSNNVSGNWVEDSKNIHHGFGIINVEDGRYMFHMVQAKDVMDYSQWGAGSERVYEAVSVGRQCADLAFVNECWDQLIDSRYCMNCHSSSNLFGCIGLRKKEYCIFNKQYSKEEYETLKAKIIEQMNAMPYIDQKGRTYPFGEFYPPETLPFAYNESIAQEYFPLSRAEAESRGFLWKDEEEKNNAFTVAGKDLPDTISGVSDDILKETIGCLHERNCVHQCTRAFRIIPDELQFYRRFNIPPPKLCSNCRHYARLAQRTPLRLWPRECQCGGSASKNGSYKNGAAHFHGAEACPNKFQTSYAPDRPEDVYCLQCYQAEVV